MTGTVRNLDSTVYKLDNLLDCERTSKVCFQLFRIIKLNGDFAALYFLVSLFTSLFLSSKTRKGRANNKNTKLTLEKSLKRRVYLK